MSVRSFIYDYNNAHHKFKKLHDETGGALKELDFKYYDCFCGEAQYRIVATTTRHRNHFDVVQCASCGTLRINPYMSDASIDRYYKEIYGRVKRSNIDAAGLFKNQSRHAPRMLTALQPYLEPQAKILDFGGGAGGRMAELKNAGYDVYLHDSDATYLAYGISQALKSHSAGTKYDMIVLSHVLEHINHPVGFLQDYLASMLSENGKIYIEVPYIENTKHLLLGDFHLAHKFYFTAESLCHLASMAGLGKIADMHNAILVSRQQKAISPPLTDAMEKSRKHVALAKKRERGVKMKRLVRQLMGKNKA